MVARHLAWFRQETGQWIGEWFGTVPAPQIPTSLVGHARLILLNEWLQQVQRAITPLGSPYIEQAHAWDLDAWDDCPSGGAVCLDVTLYNWPVGDFLWSVFDGVDRIIDFRQTRTWIELTPRTARLDASVHSSRLVRSTDVKFVADVTGTPLEPFADRLFGQFIRRDGRLMFTTEGSLPESIALSLTDRNKDLPMLHVLDPARVPEWIK